MTTKRIVTKAKYPGKCHHTGIEFEAGAEIQKTPLGWIVAPRIDKSTGKVEGLAFLVVSDWSDWDGGAYVDFKDETYMSIGARHFDNRETAERYAEKVNRANGGEVAIESFKVNKGSGNRSWSTYDPYRNPYTQL